jgi:hypothetical protein
MSKVYADKKLGYGEIKKFEKPLELTNDPIYADVNMERYFKEGDSTTVDQGNGDANDFFPEAPPPPDNKPIENIKIESEIPGDTGRSKKAGDKNPVQQPLQKPAEDPKNKKPVKPKPTNDYQ